MRVMLLFEETMKENRHSTGSCRAMRMPGSAGQTAAIVLLHLRSPAHQRACSGARSVSSWKKSRSAAAASDEEDDEDDDGDGEEEDDDDDGEGPSGKVRNRTKKRKRGIVRPPCYPSWRWPESSDA